VSKRWRDRCRHLLTPGQRLGYLAISPLMPAEDKIRLRDVTFAAQMSLGWSFASALMQHAVPALEELSIDQGALARRRDRLMAALAPAGWGPLPPKAPSTCSTAGRKATPIGTGTGSRTATCSCYPGR
jgi:aspartate/methionine/tyrosine aminotransferase